MRTRTANCLPGGLGGIVVLLLLALPAIGSTVVKMDLPDLVKTSDMIVQGRVDHAEAKWENDAIITYTTILVDDHLKGAQRQSMVIRSEGGRIGDLVMSVPGMPQFRQGEGVIVFLKGSSNGAFAVVGLNQGKYEIVGDSVVSNVDGLEILDPQSGRLMALRAASRAPVETFKARIRELMK